MTKEEKYELIELSDLNREDNIKYISSEAQGIAITLDSDRYAPTLCKLERAYICGRRKSEKKIEELEQELKQVKKVQAVEHFEAYGQCRDSKRIKELEQKLEQTEKDLADYQFNYPSIKELSKENAKLKSELTKKADTNHSLVEQMAELESENAELKAKNKWYSEQVCYKECAEVWGNLTKATEIIKKLKALYFYPVVTKDDVKRQDEILNEAEHFLREIDIGNAIQKANEGLNLDKIAKEVEDDLKEGCPDVLCEGCTEEDCTAKKLGLIC